MNSRTRKHLSRLVGNAIPQEQGGGLVLGALVSWTDFRGRIRRGRLVRRGELVAWVREKGQRGRIWTAVRTIGVMPEAEYNPNDHTSVSLADTQLTLAAGAAAITEPTGVGAGCGSGRGGFPRGAQVTTGLVAAVPDVTRETTGTNGTRAITGQTLPAPECVTGEREPQQSVAGAATGTEPRERKGKAMMKQVERTCANCGKTFQGAIVAKFCKDPECVKAVKKAWSDAYLAKKKANGAKSAPKAVEPTAGPGAGTEPERVGALPAGNPPGVVTAGEPRPTLGAPEDLRDLSPKEVDRRLWLLGKLEGLAAMMRAKLGAIEDLKADLLK